MKLSASLRVATVDFVDAASCSTNAACTTRGGAPHCGCVDGYQDNDANSTCTPICRLAIASAQLSGCSLDTCDDSTGIAHCTDVVSALPPVSAPPAAHYSARASGSIVVDDVGEVLEWHDLSGNARHLSGNGFIESVPGTTPPGFGRALINGLPAVDFTNGAGLNSPGFLADATVEGVTIFAVVQWRTPIGNFGSLAARKYEHWWQSFSNSYTDWVLEQVNDPSLTHFQIAGSNWAMNTNLTTSTNYVLSARYDPSGTALSYFARTSQVTETPATSTTAGTPLYNAGLAKSLYLGRHTDPTLGDATNAYIGEFLYYRAALSEADRNTIVSYLRARWNLP